MDEGFFELYNLAEIHLGFASEFLSDNSFLNYLVPDHIGYTCQDRRSFEDLRNWLEANTRFFFESEISGRQIVFARMKKPFLFNQIPFYFLEVADQKPDRSQLEGFDHMEFYPGGEDYDSIVGMVRKSGLKVREVVRPHHTTYDIILPAGFKIKLSRERLIDKIVREEILGD